MKLLKHLVIIGLGVFLLLGVPFLTSDYASLDAGIDALSSASTVSDYYAALRNGIDAVSSASVVIDAPSGDFVVWINQSLHPDEQNLQEWVKYFQGDPDCAIYKVFEDVSMGVCTGDDPAYQMARSFQSKLPENQMKIKKDDTVFALSRAEHDDYDLMVFSKEFLDQYQAKPTENTITVECKGADR